MIPNDFIQTLLSRVDIVEVVDRLRPAQEGRRELRRLLPVPRREDAVVHGEPDQAVLSLLRLRRARHGHRLPDGVRRQVVSRRGRGARARRRARGAARRARRRQGAARGSRPTSPSICSIAAKFYRAQLKDAPRAIDYLKGRGLTGDDRRALRHRLRARRVAVARSAPSPTTTIRRSTRRASSSRRRRQALRPLPRPRDVPDPRQPRPRHRLRRARARAAASPSTSTRRRRRCSRRAASSTACSSRGRRSATPSAWSSSRATWTSSRSRSTASSYAVATLGTSTTPVHVQKLFRLTDTRRVLLRRRRRGPQGGVARARERAARARRRQERAVPVPARRRGSGRLRAQARQGGVRAGADKARCRCPSSCCASSPRSIRRRRPKAAPRWSPPRGRYLAQIEAPVLAALLRRRLAELSGLPESELESLLGAPRRGRCAAGEAARRRRGAQAPARRRSSRTVARP